MMSTKMDAIIQKLREIFGDSDGPFYGSDIVPLVADITEGHEKLEAKNKKLNEALEMLWMESGSHQCFTDWLEQISKETR